VEPVAAAGHRDALRRAARDPARRQGHAAGRRRDGRCDARDRVAPLRCRAAISAKASSQIDTDFVALQWQGEWIVTEREHAREGRTYPVDVIELRSSQPTVYAARIAVVDDSVDVAETVCEYFLEKGVNAIPYHDGASFRKALEVEDFDAYILDWMLGDQTAAELVRGIRSSENGDAPIFLLTGKISTGEASEDEIAHIVSHYNARCEEKPVRLPILFAEVARELKITLPAAAAPAN
jgi:CheY-like chemotaxis protein